MSNGIIVFNMQQQAAIRLIQNDLRYLYTILDNINVVQPNYLVSALPYIGVTIDGAEKWIEAYNNSSNSKLEVPTFSEQEREFYSQMRSSIKFWDDTFQTIHDRLQQLYNDSDNYFASLCKPFARRFRLYDIYGADLINNHFCGNTILNGYYIPDYYYGKDNGEEIKAYSQIGGKYIALFNATQSYLVDKSSVFVSKDYGGFIKSPLGNTFNNRFVLFSMLCQINFVLYCIDGFILEECSTKLRFAYLQYYYISKIIPDINNVFNTNFVVDKKWVSSWFRNTMAHYKVGVALAPNEVILNDRLFGLVQKFFSCDYSTMKTAIIEELHSLSIQFEKFLFS